MSTKRMAQRLRLTMNEADLDEDTSDLLKALLDIDAPEIGEGDDVELMNTLNEGFDTAMSAVHNQIAAWLQEMIDD